MYCSSEPSISNFVPSSAPCWRVRSSTCATAAIEANASPRKPIVCKAKRSSAWEIFDVACRSNAIRASASDMPLPLSMTCTNVFPASLIWICICVAPASMAFSTNSFTTEAGRWITSPAAIWLAMLSGSRCMISLIPRTSPKRELPKSPIPTAAACSCISANVPYRLCLRFSSGASSRR